ncbi:MAG TPA: SCO family protein [Phycisphaerae bacterium]|nr:SCO family protein [Phycisphaerae bacterium]
MIARQTDEPLATHRAPNADPTAPPPGVAPEPKAGRGFWLMMGVSLAFVGAVAFLQYKRVDFARSGRGLATPTAEGPRLPVLGQVPDFRMTDQWNRTVTLDDLKGKIWVADFIFTSCGGPCPLMTRRMRELHDALYSRGATSVITVSLTVDPEFDTPPVLKEYAAQFDADRSNWLFLTGPQDEVFDLSIKGFKLPAVRNAAGDHQVEHSPRFVLVDHLGKIRGYYEVVTDEEMLMPRAEAMSRPMPAATRDRLIADINWIRRETKR